MSALRTSQWDTETEKLSVVKYYLYDLKGTF